MMVMRKIFSVFVLLVSLFVYGEVLAQDFRKGIDAGKRGDYSTAFSELKPLAEQGMAAAQFIIGMMYSKGDGVAQDFKQGVKWIRKAAEQGNMGAQYSLATFYDTGLGVVKDDKQDVKWLRKSAEQGYMDAQFDLGRSYLHGHGVIQDYVYALMWFKIAASQGHLDAQHFRDDEIVVGNMSSEQIAKAYALASKCLQSNYKKCSQ